MSKGDIKLLITGVISLFLAMVMGVVTLITFAFGFGGKLKEIDWSKKFGWNKQAIEQPVD